MLIRAMKNLFLLSALLLIAALSVRADSIVSIQFNGTSAFNDHGQDMGPFGGTVNGQAAQFFCVNFSQSVGSGSGWLANTTGLTSGNYSNTVLNNQTVYLEIAWLIQQMLQTGFVTPSAAQSYAEYQWALWSFTSGPSTPATDPFGTNADLVARATGAVESTTNPFTVSGWTIYSPLKNPDGTFAFGQELIVVATPEPSTILLLLVGLGAITLGIWHRKV